MDRALSPGDLEQVSLFPLPDLTLFPHQLLPLNVFEPRYRALTEHAIEQQRLIGVPRLAPGYEPDYYGSPEVLPIFGVGEAIFHHRRVDGTYVLVLRGVGRVRLLRETRQRPFRVAAVEQVVDEATTVNLEPLRRKVHVLGKQLLEGRVGPSEALIHAALDGAAPRGNSEFVMANLLRDPDERQALLEQRDPAARLTQLLAALRELGVSDPERRARSDSEDDWN